MTGGAARKPSSRSTVSPALRQGSSESAASSAGLGPVHAVAMSQVSGSNSLKPKSMLRARIRDWSRTFAEAARHADERDEKIGRKTPVRRFAQNVQAIADLCFLEVAEIGVEALQVGLVVAGEACIEVEAAAAREVEDVPLQRIAAAAVEAGCQVVFVDQRLEVLQRPIGLGAGERWREVVDDDGRSPALGLGALRRDR